MRKLLVILGTPVDDVSMEEALDRIEEFIAHGRSAKRGHQIATINADFVVKSLHDEELRRILQEADMATADGMPLVWSARLLGVPLIGRVTGADMVPALAQRAAERGHSIYFLGAAPGVAEQAATHLKKQYPALKVAGIASPAPALVQNGDPSIIEACKAADPDILLVAFGNPKQEKWIYRHAEALGIPVMMGVGGTFDFIAGVTKRAPGWMQNSGLEWFYRLLCEPRRLWKRYTVDLFQFGFFFLWQWRVMRQQTFTAAMLPTAEPVIVHDTGILRICGRLDTSNLERFAQQAHELLNRHPYLVIDLHETTFLDSAALGTLLALTKHARREGGNVWLTNIPSAIHNVLKLLRMDQFFDICDDIESVLYRKQINTGDPLKMLHLSMHS